MAAQMYSGIVEHQKPVKSGDQEREPGEIDTSAPFESVKQAANRFGGMGFWKPISHKSSQNAFENEEEMMDIVKLEEHAAQLEIDLITKEKETFNVIKELEITKNIVEELKLKLQKEGNEINIALKDENKENDMPVHQNGTGSGLYPLPSAAPGFILFELKQAKLNLTRTTSDLAEIRATVDLYNKKIEKERLSLEKTRQRLSSNVSKISCLEDEVNQTKQKVALMKDNDVSADDPLYITSELQKLSSEIERFKKVGEGANSEVVRAMSEIQETKTKIRIAEIRLVAAKKMKEAAKASEAVALAEIKALSKSEKTENVTLTFEEYSSLFGKAQKAEEASKDRVSNAMLHVDEANVSKMETVKKVEEATEEVKITKIVLEEALSRVEAANKGKLAVEESMRKWRSEKRRSSVHNSTKFKNSHSALTRKENDLDIVNSALKPVLKPTLSIGQILSRKLLLAEDYENGKSKHDISLAQMLSKPNVDSSAKKSGKENNEPPPKKKKFGFGRISRFVMKQSKKKKKKEIASSMCRQCIV